MDMKKKLVWALASLLLAVFTVWFIIRKSGMSVSDFMRAIAASNPWWIMMGILAMFGYIFFEGAALLQIVRACGYPQKMRRGFLYSASDIYLSAITPSGTGGQPGIAFFMMKDGIPAAVITAVLVVNLVSFNVGLLFHGVLGLVLGPRTFLHYHTPGKIMIVISFVLFSSLMILALMMLKHREFMFRLAMRFINFLHKIHLVKNPEKWNKKLEKTMEEYKVCAGVVSSHKRMWFNACFMMTLQRFLQTSVSIFAYRALGGHGHTVQLFATQCLATIGSTCIPIPGAMGVSDYLMLDGYMQFMPDEFAYQVQLLSRTLSFYICVIVSGITLMIGVLSLGRREKK